ncbi:MAG: polysaccharide pyruvyl transferase family protein [Patescibacteria group bacterium]|jgi:polysaccharide pyruvyl transferase WcaK-like protein
MYNKPNILNIGWVGQGDFGDEAMAFALRSFLKKNGIDAITYYQHGRRPAYRGQEEIEIKSLYNFKASQKIRRLLDNIRLRKFDALVIGGGSVLHSLNSIQWKYEVIKKIKKFNKKSLVAGLGISVGPITTADEKKACARLLDSLDIAVLRDAHSAELAKKISANPEIHSSLDTSLLLFELFTDYFSRPKKNDEDLIGLMLIKNKAREKEFFDHSHFDKYIYLINRLIKEGFRVRLFNLYIGSEYPDVELNLRLKNSCEAPDRVSIYSFNGDIFKTMDEMSRCRYVISMRLHGIIFSYLLGLPFLSLGYNPKNQYFCDSIGYPKDLSYDFNSIKDAAELNPAIENLLQRKEKAYDGALALPAAARLVKDNLDKFLAKLKSI